jgi:hypothetical protein
MPQTFDHFGFPMEAGKLIGVPLEQAPHDFHSYLPKRLVCSRVDFSHAPSGYQVMEKDLAERFSCPICHIQNYNRECGRV